MTGQTATLVILTLLVVGAVAIFLVRSQRENVVTETSDALAALGSLNRDYAHRLQYLAPMAYNWIDRVNSKAKFDRYDLGSFFLANLAAHETEIDRQVAMRLQDSSVFDEYIRMCGQISTTKLGSTRHDKLNPDVYGRVERRLFTKMMLDTPTCSAVVKCAVHYTSPKGQNSYTRSLQWDFEQLRCGLAEVNQIRTARSTSTFLRQQERNRMTARLRYQVLQRDHSRCLQCGAAARAGASLHVDHILPVSKGGRTELGNLQTLCEPCNLGKGNLH